MHYCLLNTSHVFPNLTLGFGRFVQPLNPAARGSCLQTLPTTLKNEKGPLPKVRPFSNLGIDVLEKLRAVVFHVGVRLDGLVNLAILLLGALLH